MNDFVALSQYVEFSKLLSQEDLQGLLLPYKESEHYLAALRYHASCIEAQDSPRMLTPLALLKRTLDLFQANSRRRRAPNLRVSPDSAGGLAGAQSKIEDYEARLQHSLELLKQPATEVPKKLHFVWLGGGLGDIQLDYLRIWKKTMPDFSVNVWHDPDGLLVHETNRIIVEAAKADTWLSEENAVTSANDLADLYEARVTALKRQMFMHIQQALEQGKSADEARIDLLVSGYGRDEAVLHALKTENAQVMGSLKEENIQLRDVRKLQTFSRLEDFYNREMSLRGNLAAASDLARLVVVHAEGGVYSDVDFLPPLANDLAGIEVNQLMPDARLGVLQLLLNNNPHWMPGRGALLNRYEDYSKPIPAEHLEALERFAKSAPPLEKVFVPFTQGSAPADSLRLAKIEGGESNALIVAHPGSATCEAIIERLQTHYQALLAVEREAGKRNIEFFQADRIFELTGEVLKDEFNIVSNEASMGEDPATNLCLGISDYFSDGIRPKSQGSIFLTGPGAVRAGLLEYARRYSTPKVAEQVRKAIRLSTGFNNATEEEKDHSWTENAKSIDNWFTAEKARWTEGRMRARYAADLTELLKWRSIDFQQGWPVIEGRHVLSTDLLQQLADNLGEPFMTAMNLGHTGTVTFDRLIPLGFDDRQSIVAQSASAMPPASLSDSQTQPLTVSQVLHQLAEGDLDVSRLSPLQRLQLGALIGAKALDNRSFETVRPQLDNLINGFRKPGTVNDYATIERALFAHQAPAFVAGLASMADVLPRHDETALGLKKISLEQPLTLRQWGQHAARIQQAALHEYRVRVVMRLNDILSATDPDKFRSVPQDLLLQGPGDRVAGRCYPLSLVMAAAFSKGLGAVKTLCDRFDLAIVEHDTRDSAVFLHSLESMRDMRVGDVGSALARADLKGVVSILLNKPTGTLMLNSDNHAMLVAKTSEGKSSAYHFYDPNFGVFEFESATDFAEALEAFFVKQGMASQYAAYGDAARPSFDLIELDGARVTREVLPNSVRVSELLQPDALPGQSQRSVRQRVASARGQSLQDNPRLGSCLLTLDGHWWAQQIAETATHLQQMNKLKPELAPLFDTLEVLSDGTYRMSMIDPADSEHPIQIQTNDARVLRIKTYLTERFSTLANHPTVSNDPTAVGSVHTLNAGFAIQALMNALRGREGDARTLSWAVRLHAYVNYAQLTHGNVTDIVELVGLIRKALAQEKLIANTVAPVVKASVGTTASEATGGLLQLANVGFDIYQLANADSEVERAQFGTQLAFDSAGLVLSGAALGASVVGAATAGTMLGGASVILGGLAVGVAALAQGFATIAEEAKQVGLFFDEVEHAHLHPFKFNAGSNAWLPRPSLIVQTVDLARGVLVLDSPKLYPQRDHLGVPTLEWDYERAINIREGLRLPHQVGFAPPAGQGIVLPCTPQTCYLYEYKALPGATTRNDKGFDTGRRLEENTAGKWLFDFWGPWEYIVHRLFNPDFRPTRIDVVLDDNARSLVVPVLPANWHGLVSYQIQGAGNQCAVRLNPGVSVTFDSVRPLNSSWVLDAPGAKESDIRFESSGNKISIGEIEVSFTGTGQHGVLIRIGTEQLFQVDWSTRLLNVVEQVVPSGLDQQVLREHLKALNHQHRLVAPYTPVHDYLVPFEDPKENRRVIAWYDAKEDRFLYIRDELVGDEPTFLGAVVNGYAWFYDPKDLRICQVDATTGVLSRLYWLWGSMTEDAVIKSVEADAQGIIHVVQHITRKGGVHDELAYVIYDEQLLLTSVIRDLDTELETLLSASQHLSEWSKVLPDGYVYAPSFGNEHTYETVTWQPAPFVTVCWKPDEAYRDMAWVRRDDNLIIRPAPRPRHHRGWPDSIKHMTGLRLLAQAGEGDAFAIYDETYKAVCRRQRTVVDGIGQWSNRWMQTGNVKEVFVAHHGYVAATFDDVFFDLTSEGALVLGGVNNQWFKNQEQAWWPALEPLARRHSIERFALMGLTDSSGKTSLYAWYIDNRLLLVDSRQATQVRLLDVTPDGEAAWLFDVERGEVLRQSLIDLKQAGAAFGQGSRLLQADVLLEAEREWAPWRFIGLVADGPGLRGVTYEGLVVRLRDHEPAMITGVTHEWVVAQGGHEQEALERLASSPSHSALLTVEEPDNLTWFVARTGQVIRVPKAALPAAYEVLGTQRRNNVLLRESKKGTLLTFPREGQAGPLNYAQRKGEVMVVESQGTLLDDLLAVMPDDVTTVVLRVGQGAVTYRLSKSAWRRVGSVILDCRHSLGDVATTPGKVIWELEEPDQLLLSHVDEHLVIIDPNSGCSVVCREVFATDVNLRGEVVLDFGANRHYAVSTLVARLGALPDIQSVTTLEELLELSLETI
ncbi:toxin [Pseudomonas sp. SWRI102]|uniref:Toxin n=1 Tax=Pseudomonas marvdashtae TaxID=2745500 RepID=A0A923FQT7_9PSED|nr:TcdA/TcdB pore-forming domain-containing protein [Pseudomonas marvdashtae]MBV4553496.1 toxin [Pseudomonas marvdashtae]